MGAAGVSIVAAAESVVAASTFEFDLVDDLLGNSTRQLWEKVGGPVLGEARERFDPRLYEHFEFLYQEMTRPTERGPEAGRIRALRTQSQGRSAGRTPGRDETIAGRVCRPAERASPSARNRGGVVDIGDGDGGRHVVEAETHEMMAAECAELAVWWSLAGETEHADIERTRARFHARAALLRRHLANEPPTAPPTAA